MRTALEENPHMTQEQACALLERALTVLYYRDARALNKFQIATVTAAGVSISEPKSVESNWEIAHMIRSVTLSSSLITRRLVGVFACTLTLARGVCAGVLQWLRVRSEWHQCPFHVVLHAYKQRRRACLPSGKRKKCHS
jgi:hypothetical protein